MPDFHGAVAEVACDEGERIAGIVAELVAGAEPRRPPGVPSGAVHHLDLGHRLMWRGNPWACPWEETPPPSCYR